MNLATLKKRALQAAYARIDAMGEEELLAYVGQAVLPWEARNPNSTVVAAIQYATARLENLTSPK